MTTEELKMDLTKFHQKLWGELMAEVSKDFDQHQPCTPESKSANIQNIVLIASTITKTKDIIAYLSK